MKKKIISFALTLCMMVSLSSVFSAMGVNAQETINIGDYVQMGTYYGKLILWRCVDIDENGPLMLSDKIICLKPFDAAGTNTSNSHGRGYYEDEHEYWSEIWADGDLGDYTPQGFWRQLYGSNYWGDSNIRDWLNSSASAGNVVWSCGNPPDNEHVWNGYNDYANEAGFLSNFTQEERGVMNAVTQKSLLDGWEYSNSSNTINPNYHQWEEDISEVLQNYDTAFSEMVTDTVFLLDVKQLYSVWQNDTRLGGKDYYIGYPTIECVANSEYEENDYFTASKRWGTWLRTPDADADYGFTYNGFSCYVRNIGSNGIVYDDNAACYGNNGIRPAFYLDLSSCIFASGDGSKSNPYTIGESKKGDMDGDGKLSAKDVTLLRRAIATGTASEKQIADFDRDGVATAKDVTKLRRAIASGAV